MQDQQAPDDAAAARAQEYALLATLLGRAPNAKLLESLAALRGDATPLGVAHTALAQAASETTVERVEREYFNLFIGLGRAEIMPYGSYYLTGFLHQRPLARLRADLAPLGIERAEDNKEPEDHAATLCEIMACLVGGRLPAPQGTDQQIFEKHLKPWIGRFFADVERAEGGDLYRRIGTLGRVFIDIETEAFALPS
ncbi:MAG TPA: molecular chaperone TorD family protein [Pseudolabrys sp.]|nr:molecular chaperone TorD family protein [Pseudolabrys sp.]